MKKGMRAWSNYYIFSIRISARDITKYFGSLDYGGQNRFQLWCIIYRKTIWKIHCNNTTSHYTERLAHTARQLLDIQYLSMSPSGNIIHWAQGGWGNSLMPRLLNVFDDGLSKTVECHSMIWPRQPKEMSWLCQDGNQHLMHSLKINSYASYMALQKCSNFSIQYQHKRRFL